VDLRLTRLDMSASPAVAGLRSLAFCDIRALGMRLPDTYSSALRSIGQVLEKWDMNAFDLRCSDSEFRLHCGDPTPPHLTLIKVRYTSDDISGLELKGRAKRGGSLTTAKLDSLPEILRALGHYVDSKGGRLVRICNGDVALDSSLIMLEYETRHRQVRREDFSITSIYKHTQDMHHERSRISPDIRWA
jgi:hypothetical protein